MVPEAKRTIICPWSSLSIVTGPFSPGRVACTVSTRADTSATGPISASAQLTMWGARSPIVPCARP